MALNSNGHLQLKESLLVTLIDQHIDVLLQTLHMRIVYWTARISGLPHHTSQQLRQRRKCHNHQNRNFTLLVWRHQDWDRGTHHIGGIHIPSLLSVGDNMELIKVQTRMCVCTYVYDDTSLSRWQCSNSCCAIWTERRGFPKTVWLGRWVCSQWGGQRLALLDNFSLSYSCRRCLQYKYTTIPIVAFTMQDIQYSDVNMVQLSKDRTSVPWWMNVQLCRVELCVGGLTSIFANSSPNPAFSASISLLIFWMSLSTNF